MGRDEPNTKTFMLEAEIEYRPTGLSERLPEAALEEWMRLYYFQADIDIGSSGVQDFSLAEIRALTNIDHSELDSLVFHDSQTLGGQEVRRQIAERWDESDPERAMATHGSTEANFLLMQALVKPGDEVLALDPCYQQLFAIAQTLGCRLKRWPMRPEKGFAPDIEEAARLITPQTRMVIVNFPHNPTGATLTTEEQKALIDLVEEAGAYLIWDGAFHELTYGQPPLPWPNRLSDRAISMGTFSKAYGLPGLRFGWCVAPPDVLERCIRLRDYTMLHLSPLVELIACRVIENADRILEIRRAQARGNLALLREWAERNHEVLEWLEPRGGVCTFPKLRRVADVEAFCHQLGERQKVLLVPGICFGQADRVRLGFGGSTEDLAEGLRRLESSLHRAARADV